MGTDSHDAIESASQLFDEIQRAFPEAVMNFESKWTAWQEICYSETASKGFNECTQTDEFEALHRLGPKTLPFVVFKLAQNSDQNLPGVFLYDVLEFDPEYRTNPDKQAISKEALESHKNRIIQLNHQRNIVYKERVRLWKEHCQLYRLRGSAGTFTECEEYFDLLDMGPSIIAPLMVEYFNEDGAGYWYELLHEIVHGRKMGAYMVRRGVLFDECCRFFNCGDHDQAPKYIPNEWDIFVYTRQMGPQVWEYFRRLGP